MCNACYIFRQTCLKKHGLVRNRKINIQNTVYFTPDNLIIILEIIILCGIIIYEIQILYREVGYNEKIC